MAKAVLGLKRLLGGKLRQTCSVTWHRQSRFCNIGLGEKTLLHFAGAKQASTMEADASNRCAGDVVMPSFAFSSVENGTQAYVQCPYLQLASILKKKVARCRLLCVSVPQDCNGNDLRVELPQHLLNVGVARAAGHIDSRLLLNSQEALTAELPMLNAVHERLGEGSRWLLEGIPDLWWRL